MTHHIAFSSGVHSSVKNVLVIQYDNSMQVSALSSTSSMTKLSSSATTSSSATSSGKLSGMAGVPPGVPAATAAPAAAMLGGQYILGQAGLPIYSLQQPT